jgi:NADH-quinone oxidoreductase subunit J
MLIIDMYLNVFFYVFSILLVICAFMVIVSRHQVFSLLFLVGSFILSAFLLLVLECELLALLFIVIYVGAIAVLFLFSVMMLESKLQSLSKNTMQYVPVGILFGVFFTWPFISAIKLYFIGNSDKALLYLNNFRNWYDIIDNVKDIEVYGQILYSYYVFQLLVSGLLLLVILVGVVFLTNSFGKPKSLRQSAFKQLSRNSKFFFKKI